MNNSAAKSMAEPVASDSLQKKLDSAKRPDDLGIVTPLRGAIAQELKMAIPYFDKQEKIGLPEIENMAQIAKTFTQSIQVDSFLPSERKEAPTLNSNQMSSLLGIDRRKLGRILEKHPQLPQGMKNAQNGYRYFTVKEAAEIYRQIFGIFRPENVLGKICCVGNFKGGVGKSTICVSLAQALALRGLKVLVVDVDPQGTSSAILGYLPDRDFDEQDTILNAFPPLYVEDGEDMPEFNPFGLSDSPKETYWPGVDLIGGSVLLQEVEIRIMNQMQSEDVLFWEMLGKNLDNLRDKYDVILIDTPPAFSFCLTSVLMASDGILCPLPPKPLEIMSSAAFWDICGDVMTSLQNVRSDAPGVTEIKSKTFDFIDILATKVPNHRLTPLFMDWMKSCYPGRILPFSIPESDSVANSCTSLKTIYDDLTPIGSPRAYEKIKGPMDSLADHMLGRLTAHWITKE